MEYDGLSSMTLGEYPWASGLQIHYYVPNSNSFLNELFYVMFFTITLRVTATADATTEADLRHATISAELV